MRLLIAAGVTCLCVQLPQPGDPIPKKLVPVHDERKDPSLVRVITDVRSAAQAGDLQAVLSHVSTDVVSDQRATKGIPALLRSWHADQSPKAFLDELELVLSLGGRLRSDDDYVAPSMFIDFPDEVEMPAYVVAIKKDAPVFTEMSASSTILKRCNSDVLRATVISSEWTQVKLDGGIKGYMRASDVRSPGATRVFMNRINGVWKITGMYGGIE